jgi:hypothetical protein
MQAIGNSLFRAQLKNKSKKDGKFSDSKNHSLRTAFLRIRTTLWPQKTTQKPCGKLKSPCKNATPQAEKIIRLSDIFSS